jgi:hypothetical protein
MVAVSGPPGDSEGGKIVGHFAIVTQQRIPALALQMRHCRLAAH